MENKNENGVVFNYNIDNEDDYIIVYYFNKCYYVKINDKFVKFKTRKIIESYLYKRFTYKINEYLIKTLIKILLEILTTT